jgi:hypothetical protein
MFWAVMAVVVSAAGVWDEKPFTQWSDKDVDKLLTDSPWAGKGSLTHERAGSNLGPVPEWKLIISVRSALPMKQALLRKQLGAGVAPSAEQEAALAVADARYVLAISGIPRSLQRQLTKSAQSAQLRVHGREPISATDASVFLIDKGGKLVPPTAGSPAPPQASLSGGALIVPVAQRGGGGGGFGGGGFGGGGFGGGGFGEDKSGITATLIVEFPRTNPITVADQEVEFWTILSNYAVKHTFKLKDMMYKGALAF